VGLLQLLRRAGFVIYRKTPRLVKRRTKTPVLLTDNENG
jgi:hypothetical protein